MKEHNYAFQNADTRPRLQSRTQNGRMVEITSIFGSYSFLRIALHDIFSLSHHLLASWNCISPVLRSRRAKKALESKKALELKSNPQVNHRTHLKDSCVS